MPDTPLSLKVYRRLLQLYPAGFRENYAAPMEREFCDELEESSGPLALAKLWVRLLADLAISIPTQIVREMAQDARHTLRLWANRPWNTGFAIAALAIGIGANTGVFSVVNALLLRSLPFHDPGRLASMSPYEYIPPHGSAKEFHEWQTQSAYLAGAALVEENDVNLGGERDAIRAHHALTSWNFFTVLGAQPALGRGFLPEEETPGHDGVAVISYGLWQQLFAGDPRALGATVRVNGDPLTIVGVAPGGFEYPNHSVLWKAATYSPGNNGWATVARLKPGITWAQARAAFSADAGDGNPRPQLRSLQDALAGRAKDGSLLLMAGVALVLLIACTNVANLLIARTVDRAPELAIRSALGASQARLVQQLLTESLLLSFVATIAGFVVAYWTTALAAAVQPPPLAAQSYSIFDSAVVAFSVLISVASALLFGILPALHTGRLRASGSRVIRQTLAAAQVMLTIVLLTASVSVGRAFLQLMATDRGYDVKGVVTVNVALDGTTHQINKRQRPYFEEVLARLRRIPGVRSASATEFLPLYATGFVGGPFGLDGQRAKRNSTMLPVMSDYFQTMGGRIQYGREFTGAEVRNGAMVAVVNERFAANFGAPQDAVGHEVTVRRGASRKIVGVVKGMDFATDPTMIDPNQVFIPSSTPGGFFSTFVARVDGPAEAHLSTIRDTVRSVDPAVPVFGVKTLEQRQADLFARPRFYRTAVWLFSGFALLLAVIGIYGIVSYAVAQRTREMGVRLALGTTAVHLRAMLLRQELITVVVGAIPGIAAASLTGRYLESLIEGAESTGLATSLAVALLLAFIASTSIWAGTRRIASLDIMSILRTD
ncbi:MAG: ABC transporter permease [Acidobacteria bacterium]|nr:ABC transporter permease [Acidobacteriota bacterium]